MEDRKLEELTLLQHTDSILKKKKITDQNDIKNLIWPSCRDLEEDPLFGDEVPTDSRPPNSEWFSLSPLQSPDHPKNDVKTEVHKIVNRWADSWLYSRGLKINNVHL